MRCNRRRGHWSNAWPAFIRCMAACHWSEFYGAALLAEDEQLVIALQQGRVSQVDEALRLLQQAFSQLPLYLDRVHSARRDWPLVVLPLLNDLRSARGQALLSETSLFSPPLQEVPALDAEALARLQPEDLPRELRALRHSLQAAFPGLRRGEAVQANLEIMAGCSPPGGLCQGSPLNALWKIAAALVDGMLKGRVPTAPALRSLLKSLTGSQAPAGTGHRGHQSASPRRTADQPAVLLPRPSTRITKMLALKNHYELDQASLKAMVDEERARLAGPDRDAMRSVVAALCEEPAWAKGAPRPVCAQ